MIKILLRSQTLAASFAEFRILWQYPQCVYVGVEETFEKKCPGYEWRYD